MDTSNVVHVNIRNVVVPLCGRVRVRRAGGEIVQWCDTYIGRQQTQGGWNLPASIWANPYKVSPDDDIDVVCAKYYHYVKNSPQLMSRIEELRGKILGCWCERQQRPLDEILNKPKCHGEVLMRILYEISTGN